MSIKFLYKNFQTMKKHIILTNGRSGSNYLVTLLNSHPQIANYGEVLGEWTTLYKVNQKVKFGQSLFNDYYDYMNYVYNSKLFFYISHIYSGYSKIKKQEKINFKSYQNIKTIGVKEFSINFKKRNIVNYIKEQEDLFIINLCRKNSLKRLISLEAMKNTGVISSKKTKENKQIYLSAKNTLQQLEIFEKEKQDQFEMLESVPNNRILNIYYEDYFSEEKKHKKINKEILDFLQVKQINISSKHRKILDSDLSNIIKNYDEIYNLLANSPYEKYLIS